MHLKPKPRDEAQVAIWKRHQKNLTTAAAEIGVAPTTLRARLIAWGDHDPAESMFCRNCGKAFRRKQSQVCCPRCIKKRKNQKKAKRRRKPMTSEYSPMPPRRRHDCRFYEQCLSRAAHGKGQMACNKCRKYAPISIGEQVARGPSCAHHTLR